MQPNEPIAQNVQALVDKLHLQGVKAGKEEAEAILQKANEKAKQIIEEAEQRAKVIQEEAIQELEAEKKATHEAFKIALRNSVLTLKNQLFMQFKTHLQKLITQKLQDENFLEEMILTISSNIQSDENIELIVGRVENYESRQDAFIESIVEKMTTEGIKLGKLNRQGIKIQFIENNLEIDLSDEALTDLIYQLIIPRYQEMFDGVRSS
ncbi:MAG: hypothetical protein K0U38_09190 [Epsilonproteobacteria bacterium]|nr:hypothetical protein [Campylobacterota bacterium]